MVAAKLNFLGCLVRCISSYLVGENADPCLFAQVTHWLCVRIRAAQLCLVDFPHARMFISSTNPRALERKPVPLQIRMSSSLKNRYNIGEIGEP